MASHLSKTTIEKLKKILMQQLAVVRGDINQMEEESLSKSFTEQTGELTTMPGDIADVSAESFDQEFSVKLLENKGELAREIEEALERIEEGTYGLCEECGKPIKKERLFAIPYARLCIECQRKVEAQRRRR